MGPLRPATPQERLQARERLWEAAERWRYKNRRTHRRKRVYYQEACLAMGVMDLEEADDDWRVWNRWVLLSKGKRYTGQEEQ